MRRADWRGARPLHEQLPPRAARTATAKLAKFFACTSCGFAHSLSDPFFRPLISPGCGASHSKLSSSFQVATKSKVTYIRWYKFVQRIIFYVSILVSESILILLLPQTWIKNKRFNYRRIPYRHTLYIIQSSTSLASVQMLVQMQYKCLASVVHLLQYKYLLFSNLFIFHNTNGISNIGLRGGARTLPRSAPRLCGSFL